MQTIKEPETPVQKDKQFQLRIPFEVWDKARRLAGAEAISLHDFIIAALIEKVDKGGK
ncbi:MAG: hypothetical protein ACLQF0_12950 [Dissulfurispiraceae bacterium]